MEMLVKRYPDAECTSLEITDRSNSRIISLAMKFVANGLAVTLNVPELNECQNTIYLLTFDLLTRPLFGPIKV